MLFDSTLALILFVYASLAYCLLSQPPIPATGALNYEINLEKNRSSHENSRRSKQGDDTRCDSSLEGKELCKLSN